MRSAFVAFFGLSLLVCVSQAMDPGYYEVTAPEVKLIEVSRLNPTVFASTAIGMGTCRDANNSSMLFSATVNTDPTEVTSDLNALDMALDQIINIGKKVWSLVQAGKPVVNLQTDVATALPLGAKCWLDLQNWQAPVSRTYSVTYKNLYGVEVVKFNYRIVSVAGGSVNGQGAYIGYAALEPSNVEVAWGYTFNAQSAVAAVYNMGSKEAPVAGMNLQMKYSIDTVIKHIEASQSYFLNGQGSFQQLN